MFFYGATYQKSQSAGVEPIIFFINGDMTVLLKTLAGKYNATQFSIAIYKFNISDFHSCRLCFAIVGYLIVLALVCLSSSPSSSLLSLSSFPPFPLAADVFPFPSLPVPSLFFRGVGTHWVEDMTCYRY